ncbi:MAG TPA: carbohydrate ABC transporter permease [Dehalococcoidia bacterium]|nr:carbohydrate ABC transporter permease [Dehalococcoidia bacterium]
MAGQREVAVAPAGPRLDVGKIWRALLARAPIHVAVIGLVVVWSIPTIALLVSSFRDPGLVVTSGWWRAIADPLEFTIDNYETVLDRQGMGQSFVNSLIITIPSTFLVILVAAFAAYAFAWMRFPFRNALFLIVVALLVVPLQMTLIPILRLYVNVNENFSFLGNEVPLMGGRIFGTNSFLGIWLAHTAFGLPFAVYLLRNFFGGLPRDLFESAYMDGASDLAVFFRIVLPLSMPAIAALTIFQFLWVWNDLLIALVLLGDPDMAPMTLTITNLVSSFGTAYQLLTAAAFISMALPLLIFFALQRYFVQGILAGAVKG